MYEVLAYTDQRGRSPFDLWLDRQAPPVQRRIHQVLARMVDGNMGDVRSIGGEVIERRVHFGPGYRLYFAWDGPTLIIMLCGGDKSSQRNDITSARARWQDYKNRSTGG